MAGNRGHIAITGAAGAIGQEVTKQALAEGYHVLATDLSERGLQDLATTCQSDRLSVHVSALEDRDACVSYFESGPGPVSALVHLAGIYEKDGKDSASWNRSIDVNLTMAHRVVDAFLKARDTDRKGRVVLFGSIAGEIGSLDHIAYSAAKAGLKGLMHGLARQYAPDVTANVIAPGMIESPMGSEAIRERGDKMLAAIPARRFAQSAEMAPLALFLCSDAADYITGQTLQINGGAYMT